MRVQCSESCRLKIDFLFNSSGLSSTYKYSFIKVYMKCNKPPILSQKYDVSLRSSPHVRHLTDFMPLRENAPSPLFPSAPQAAIDLFSVIIVQISLQFSQFYINEIVQYVFIFHHQRNYQRNYLKLILCFVCIKSPIPFIVRQCAIGQGLQEERERHSGLGVLRAAPVCIYSDVSIRSPVSDIQVASSV